MGARTQQLIADDHRRPLTPNSVFTRGQQPCFIDGDQLEELVSVHKSALLRLRPVVEGSGHPHVPGKMHMMMVCLRQPDRSCKMFDPHVAVEGRNAGKKQAAPICTGLQSCVSSVAHCQSGEDGLCGSATSPWTPSFFFFCSLPSHPFLSTFSLLLF